MRVYLKMVMGERNSKGFSHTPNLTPANVI